MYLNAAGQPQGTPYGLEKALPSFGGTPTVINTSLADLSTATANANPGDVIINDVPDATQGQFVMKKRVNSTGWIWVRPTDARMAGLPAYVDDYLTAGHQNRIKASHASSLAKIKSAGVGATVQPVVTDAQAEGIWLTGMEVMPGTGSDVHGFGISIRQLTGGSDFANAPKRIALDRIWVHDDLGASGGDKLPNGIRLEGEQLLVAHCRVGPLRSTAAGGDHHAIGGIHGPKGALIFNSLLDGWGMCFFMGGGGPSAITNPANFLSQDVALIRCELYPNPAYPTNAQRKNLWEIKGGRRFFNWGLVGHHYISFGQIRAWTINVVNQDGDFTWIEAHDIIQIACLWHDNQGGTINIHPRGVSSGCGGTCATLGVRNVQFMHDAWIKHAGGAVNGRFEYNLVSASPYDTQPNLQVDHCHGDNAAWTLSLGDGSPGTRTGFFFRNNTNSAAHVQGVGPVFAGAPPSQDDSACLDLRCGVGNWDYRRNVGVSGGGVTYDSVLSDTAHENKLVAATDIFVDVNDVTKGVKAPYDTYATDGTPVGPNWRFVLAATANVEEV